MCIAVRPSRLCSLPLEGGGRGWGVEKATSSPSPPCRAEHERKRAKVARDERPTPIPSFPLRGKGLGPLVSVWV